jgi:hypothetical protein
LVVILFIMSSYMVRTFIVLSPFILPALGGCRLLSGYILAPYSMSVNPYFIIQRFAQKHL